MHDIHVYTIQTYEITNFTIFGQTHEAYKFVGSGKVIKLNPNPLALCTTYILPWDLWPSKTNK
jgi:hypothetical protein